MHSRTWRAILATTLTFCQPVWFSMAQSAAQAKQSDEVTMVLADPTPPAAAPQEEAAKAAEAISSAPEPVASEAEVIARAVQLAAVPTSTTPPIQVAPEATPSESDVIAKAVALAQGQPATPEAPVLDETQPSGTASQAPADKVADAQPVITPSAQPAAQTKPEERSETPALANAEAQPAVELRGASATPTDETPRAIAQAGRISTEAPAASDLDGLSNGILRDEISLANMTTDFREANAKTSPFHKWFTAAISTASYGTADAGNIVTFANGFGFKNQPQNFHLGRRACGPFLIFLGETFFFGRCIGEEMIDLYNHYTIDKKGFSQKTYQEKARSLIASMNTKLAARKALVGGASNSAAYAQEQTALQDSVSAVTKEFIDNYARVSRIQATHLWENLVGNYASATGAFWGGLDIFEAGFRGQPRIAGSGGIGFICEGSGFILKDFTSHLMAVRGQHHATDRLTAEFPGSDPAALTRLKGDVDGLQVADDAMARRKKAMGLLDQAMVKDHEWMDREMIRLKHKWEHDQVINTAEGGACIAAGTQIACAGYSFHNTPNVFFEKQRASTFLTRFSEGAIIFTPTASLGLVDTPGEAIYDSIRLKKDCSDFLCPAVDASSRRDWIGQAAKAL